MNLKSRKQRLVSEINITPFTDVILVLLIVFMLTTPLIMESNIKVKLPYARSGKAVEGTKQGQVFITVSNEGLTYLDGKLVTKKELKEKVSIIHKDNPALNVILRSDRYVRFKDIVDVLDMLNEQGISNLNIAATSD